MQNFNVKTRNELQDDYRVFYVTAWGYAADHLIGWFPKALNCHHDMFALLAHEGSRPKYLAERTRAERPALVPFTEFLNDMGMTYSAIGDCYSYRAGQMPSLLGIEHYSNIPVVNLVRHPAVWLEYYVRWRSSNMRMREGVTDPLAWEWKTTCHGYFEHLGLPGYSKDDIDIWASYQGMFQLNNVLGDIHAVDKHMPIEKVADDPEIFEELVNYLSHGKIEFEQSTIDVAYAMRDTLFRGESHIETNPDVLIKSWPGWKVDAFRKLVNREAIDTFRSFGYDLNEVTRTPIIVKSVPNKVQRSIFVSSLPKSGTWVMREILEMITGLKSFEPEVVEGEPDYEDEMLIEFPSGRFFSWHSILTSRTISLLNGCQSKNIFLIRNIYDVLLSMYNHLVRDVDATIGRSVGGSDYFKDKTTEQCLTLMISGFTAPEMTWMGVGPVLRQIDSMLSYVESGHALLIDYKELTSEKRKSIKKIMKFLELKLPEKRIKEILANTEKDFMRERLRKSGHDLHVTEDSDVLHRDAFSPYHKEMLDRIVMTEAPLLSKRLENLKFNTILYLEESEEETRWTQLKQNMKKRLTRDH
jgi:Sulfotransferase domain